ncbi:hypothetical protein H6G20_12840 [Desertifilum sp. FACHB-1129]|uniref:Uncharacterized protein n=1 Tax=Desertifilum tharense IPPAS B-1220 TaxID=1781255 RepID=A0A1E5QEP4_9CYAN|nr:MULTISPECIES: hypothetical protein [Desertifilum]MDA0212881.1 hypothetical protein [Cyanobacteria bacterium FC1]MBD2312550.1 hypothetical protein [Desertifilum sp. FACHB-1129]MBD2323492.1 hypothetical protein [Desertifilum sp. FACHB-866]MBD2333337.1 hypothetical protein [Desertifilum sp. FACHB-868]OEJ73150.1 hypothetical protein BH720_21640 [Desertifilum tharense IPPAS B-1220]
MSLIHLEKSVLTFHLKEILENGQGNHPLTWLSLGLLILGPRFFATRPQTSQPPASTPLPSSNAPLTLSQWVAQAQQRESLQQIGEARAHH